MSTRLRTRGPSGRAVLWPLAGLGLLLLGACGEDGRFDPAAIFGDKAQAPATASGAAPSGATVIERDVEAPEVFSASEAALWDGRPSLGGVWVAHPDVKEPERVLIRNTSNGRFVVGALFRREREIPGPRFQLSSDAAVALDVLAGAPLEIDVVALRKEKIETAPPAEAVETAQAEPSPGVPAPASTPVTIRESTLDPAVIADATIATAAPATVAPPVAAAPAAAMSPAVASTLPVSRLEKPYVQAGIFNLEANAEAAARQIRGAGMTPTVLAQESRGKPFWRVIVGPAATESDRRALQDKTRGIGFPDAYPVTN